MRSQAESLGLSTNIIWVEWWVFSETHLFPSNYWREESGDVGLVGAGGGPLLICPMQCQHLTNFMQPFKWLLPLAHLCFLLTSHWASSQRNRSMQMSYRPLKGQLALNKVYLGDNFALYDSHTQLKTTLKKSFIHKMTCHSSIIKNVWVFRKKKILF